MDVRIMPVEASDPEFARLVAALDAYLIPLYPAQSNHGLPIGALRAAGVRVWLARAGMRAAGCVCLFVGEDKLPEIKRLYVDPAFRGCGIASALLTRLEGWARGQGFRDLYLETGIYQMDAVALYEKQGFSRVGRFGAYPDDPLSLYMHKPIADDVF
ncbi:GNAT family N-acetyltransferase [Sodalis sp. RH24]|uniref:GNAT family N-acetyltransferase n=1 Tax=unclassified Sodalis (in: enterobacteria) TaxID=2636512 RepID=UPI0039B6380A